MNTDSTLTNEQDLKDRRILFIAPMFFGYEKIITDNLLSRGAEVYYFNDRPNNQFLTKALIRINRKLLSRKTDKYYCQILEETKNIELTDLLLIRGEAMSSELVDKFNNYHAHARKTLYLWDSIYYNPNAKKIHNKFDNVFSFDRKDCLTNETFKFIPLFYSEGFKLAAQSLPSRNYDACFIGTIHTDRYKILERVINELTSDGKRLFIYCYYPSKTLFILRSLIDIKFWKFGKKYISFTGLPLSKVIEIVTQSKSVIDINRPGQNGLTMRSIEALGAKTKLLTTNEDIVNYNIYNQNTVMIVDRHNPKINCAFLSEDSCDLFDESIRDDYSVTAWVSKLLLAADTTQK